VIFQNTREKKRPLRLSQGEKVHENTQECYDLSLSSATLEAGRWWSKVFKL
jgi:hypothetical protein